MDNLMNQGQANTRSRIFAIAMQWFEGSAQPANEPHAESTAVVRQNVGQPPRVAK